MQAQAYFKNIKEVIAKKLVAATKSIHTAVAWVTDSELINILEQKLQQGLSINLLLVKDQINEYQKDRIDGLKKEGAAVYWLSEAEEDRLMHHKFCVIDKFIVLMGSYNWSKKAATKNYEDMTVITGSISFAAGFIEEFDRIVNNHFKEEKQEPTFASISILLKRLEVIKSLIFIGDVEDINVQVKKLEPYQQDETIESVCEALIQRRYGDAVTLISNFTKHSQQLISYIDPAISGLQLEIQMLEVEITAISDEYNEIQQIIHQFGVRHTKELGELIKEILYLRKLKAEKEAMLDNAKQKAFEEAKQDYNDYYQNYEKSQNETVKELNIEDKKQLKKLYRKASMLCHPDKVSIEQEELAQSTFNDLNKVYQANDLDRLKEIYNQIENGIVFINQSTTITKVEQLRKVTATLRQKRQEWLKQLNELKTSSSYIKVSNIEDWDAYFQMTYEYLKEELEPLAQST